MKLKILIVHTRYQQKGGEDTVVAAETELLKNNGHAVQVYYEDNKDIHTMSRLKLACNTIWSTSAASNIKKIIKEFQPDIIHSHNTFPLMSPSIYWTARHYKIPVVQTLHNFRLICPQAMLLRDEKICEDCIGHLPWRSIINKCYHDSSMQSAVITSMLILHRLINTYQSKISAYIALSEYSRKKFI
ncbi:MAG: glycosyltransferase, partial [Methylococcales bacterium]